MRTISIIYILFISLTLVSCATKSPEMERLEAREQVLKLNKKLNDYRMDYEKERLENKQLQMQVKSYNEDANKATNKFKTTENPGNVASDAKSAQKILKKAEKANEDLAKSNQKLEKIQKKIDEVQSEIDELNKKIEFVDQKQ